MKHITIIFSPGNPKDKAALAKVLFRDNEDLEKITVKSHKGDCDLEVTYNRNLLGNPPPPIPIYRAVHIGDIYSQLPEACSEYVDNALDVITTSCITKQDFLDRLFNTVIISTSHKADPKAELTITEQDWLGMQSYEIINAIDFDLVLL